MEVRDALKQLRSELGFTQTDLANAIHVNYATISRWELGKSLPNRSLSAALLVYAHSQSVSEHCYNNLKMVFSKTAKEKLSNTNGKLYTVEHSSLSQLIDNASFPIYVCDIDSYELLYMNVKAEHESGITLKDKSAVKCYSCFMHRDSPCPFCHKETLCEERFTGFDTFKPESGEFHRGYGKLIRWQGKNAQIRYIENISGTVNVSPLSEREAAYRENLRIRKEYTRNSLVSAHYNLTKNTVSEIESSNERWHKIVLNETIDQVLMRLKNNTVMTDEGNEPEDVFSRKALVSMYYRGKTHIIAKHYLNSISGYFTVTFDLMQNPVTYDIEAFASLRDISEEMITRKVIDKVLNIDYETIATIDAATGKVFMLCGTQSDAIMSEHTKLRDNSEGVKAYLRKHCVEEDIDRVILQTSLPYIITKLASEPIHTVLFSTFESGTRMYKKVLYTYLDSTKALILCTMYDISAAFRDSMLRNDRLSEAVNTLCEVSGMNIARYDLKTKTYYSDHAVTTDLGYGKVINNVPETFVNDGNVAPQSISVIREFYDRLQCGEAASMSPYLRVAGKGFHLFNAYSRIVFDENNQPFQAIIVFQDVEEIRRETATFCRIKKLTANKPIKSYAVYSCNLSDEDPPEKLYGELESPFSDSGAQRYRKRMSSYAQSFVHPDDRTAYSELMDKDALFKAYKHGVRVASIDYREKTADNGVYRWLHLNLEMEQYPDCTDIAIYILLTSSD